MKLWREFRDRLSPQDDRLARTAVVDELSAIANDHPDSFANQQLQMELAIQRMILDPTNAKNQQNIQYLEGEGYLDDQRLEELDHYLKDQLEDLPKEGLKPGDVLRLFLTEQEEQQSWWTPSLAWATLATLFSLWLAGSLLGWFLKPAALPAIPGVLQERPSELARLNNAAVALYAPNADGQLVENYDPQRINQADSLLQTALRLDSTYVPARKNTAWIPYAQALTGYWAYHENRSDTLLGSRVLAHFEDALRADSVYSLALHGKGLMHHYLGQTDSACATLAQWQNRQILEQDRIYPNLAEVATYCGDPETIAVVIYYENDWELPVADELMVALRTLDNVLPSLALNKVPLANQVTYQDPNTKDLATTMAALVRRAMQTEGFKPDAPISPSMLPDGVLVDGDIQIFLQLPQPQQPITIIGRVTSGGTNQVQQTTQITIAALPNVPVQIAVNDRGLNRTTDAQGQFSLELPPTDIGQPLRIRINQEGYAPFDERYTIAAGLSPNIDLVPTAGGGEAFPPVPTGPYACRKLQLVDDLKLAFRNRPLSRSELDAVNASNQATLIDEIANGTELALIDSSQNLYRIQYQDSIGFIARTYKGISTLQPCDRYEAFGPVPPPPYACRTIESVDNALAFRSQPLLQASLNDINAGRDEALNAETLLSRIPAGTEIELIDSAQVNYRIRYNNQIGYIVRRYRQATTLTLCTTPPPPSISPRWYAYPVANLPWAAPKNKAMIVMIVKAQRTK